MTKVDFYCGSMRKAGFLIAWTFLPSQFQTGYNSRRRKMVTVIFYHPQHLIPFGTMWYHLVLIIILIVILIVILIPVIILIIILILFLIIIGWGAFSALCLHYFPGLI